jgi:hypothetical protein
MLIASILMFKNAAADTEQTGWKWPKATKDALVSQMAQHRAGPVQYQAYQLLAGYNYQGKALPVKVGAGVVQAYLAAIGQPPAGGATPGPSAGPGPAPTIGPGLGPVIPTRLT